MASITHRPNGHRWVQFVDAQDRRQTVRLGKTTKRNAEEVCRRIEHLLAAKLAGDTIDRQTAQWLDTIQPKLRDRLVAVGLADPTAKRLRLGEWWDQFIAKQTHAKPNSTANYERTKRCMLDYFGTDRMLDAITPADASDWRIWMLTERNLRDKSRRGLSDETVRRRCGRAKTLYREAIRRGHATTNPFVALVSTCRGNVSRQHFVDAATIDDCIEAAPCGDWRTILALCRYGGLRCPTEVLSLQWSDINLPEGHFTIRATKTEHTIKRGIRVCPIFPELRPHLEAAYDAAPKGATKVITRYTNPEQNLRTTFEKIITRAGHQPWPRLFQNLRATRETELLAKFPAKDVAEWLGNSVPVAMMHYAMATRESFERAKQTPSSTTATTGTPAVSTTAPDDPPDGRSADETPSTEPKRRSRTRSSKSPQAKQNAKQRWSATSGPERQPTQKPAKNSSQTPLPAATLNPTPLTSVPPKGCEPLAFSQALAVQFGLPEAKAEALAADADFERLVLVWDDLDPSVRRAIGLLVETGAARSS